MKLLSAKFDTSNLNNILNNSVQYSFGFLDGIQQQRLSFNRFLGGYTAEALNKYIDAKARSNPYALHHVYEPNATGNEGARLFKFEVVATLSTISFLGSFLPSSVASDTASEPFIDKANIMENGISVVVSPKNSDVLVFEDDGETVFTTESIYIEHPGGDAVAGSFGRTVDDFFTNYFTNALLAPLLKDLSTAEEFVQDFSAGTRGGRPVGVRAGRRYFNISGVSIR